MRFYSDEIQLSGKAHKDVITFDNRTYLLTPYGKKFDRARGGNSFVFNCKEADSGEEFIIKFNRYDDANVENSNAIARFNREIEALALASESDFEHVVTMYFDGYVKFGSRIFHYYVMEKGECDLTSYLSRKRLSDQQKLLLCMDILEGIRELHSIDVYHRDIKPDNIFFVDRVWKVGDLGLIDKRNTDFPINEFGKKIGPYGWLSPEAMNKFLCERHNTYGHDCILDEFSDVFQLGKLFWFVFQGNVPIGQIDRNDFLSDDNDLYNTVFGMLEYAKNRRLTLEDISQSFEELSKNYNI